MKLFKKLFNKTVATSGAFAIGVVCTFAFKNPPAKRAVKDLQTRFTWNSTNPATRQCVQTTCTNTVTPVNCGINGVFQDNTCQTPEPVTGYVHRHI